MLHAFEVILAATSGGPLLLFPLGGYLSRRLKGKEFGAVDRIIDEAIDIGRKVHGWMSGESCQGCNIRQPVRV